MTEIEVYDCTGIKLYEKPLNSNFIKKLKDEIISGECFFSLRLKGANDWLLEPKSYIIEDKKY